MQHVAQTNWDLMDAGTTQARKRKGRKGKEKHRKIDFPDMNTLLLLKSNFCELYRSDIFECAVLFSLGK